MYRFLTAGLLALTACSVPVFHSSSSGTPTSATASSTTATTVTIPSTSTTATTAAAAVGTLEIAIEIHVENSDDPTAELQTVRTLAAEATEHGFFLTFSLDEQMLQYLAAAPTTLTDELRAVEADGHQFGLHADLATMGQRAATMHLAEMASEYTAAFGHAPSTLSGACTASGDWVAAALANHLSTLAGTVLYCERSLTAATYAGTAYQDEIAWAQRVCTRPSVAGCHDPAPQADDAQRVQPWRTDSARTWLTASPVATSVKIVPTLGNTSMECAGEGASGHCAFDAANDAAGFVALAVQADTLSDDAAGATLHMAWSTNNRPSDTYIADLFDAISASIAAAGPVQWVTLSSAG